MHFNQYTVLVFEKVHSQVKMKYVRTFALRTTMTSREVWNISNITEVNGKLCRIYFVQSQTDRIMSKVSGVHLQS